MNHFTFQLITPEKTLLTAELVSLTVPTSLGQITILPGHALLVARLDSGELIAVGEGDRHTFGVVGGFVHVKPGNTVIVLADTAARPQELDSSSIEAAVLAAQMRLSREHLSAEEVVVVSAKLERDLSYLRIARKHAHRRKSGIMGEGVLEE